MELRIRSLISFPSMRHTPNPMIGILKPLLSVIAMVFLSSSSANQVCLFVCVTKISYASSSGHYVGKAQVQAHHKTKPNKSTTL